MSLICECGHGIGVHGPSCPCGCEAFVGESDGFAEAYWREQARIRGEIVGHLEAERDRYRAALLAIAPLTNEGVAPEVMRAHALRQIRKALDG